MVKHILFIVVTALLLGGMFHFGKLYHGLACVYDLDLQGFVATGQVLGREYLKCTFFP